MNGFVIKINTTSEDVATTIISNLSQLDCKFKIERDDYVPDYNFSTKDMPYSKLGERSGRTTDEYKKDMSFYNYLSNILTSYGLSSNHKGFKYTIECVRLINNYGLESYTMEADVYGVVAGWYKVSAKSVEHDIRNAIKTAWDKATCEDESNFNINHSFSRKPSNVKFLKHIARHCCYMIGDNF